MGKRDFRWRERKKPKTTGKKPQTIPQMLPQAETEVIKKGKKEREEE
jgi:hypothetical protein